MGRKFTLTACFLLALLAGPVVFAENPVVDTPLGSLSAAEDSPDLVIELQDVFSDPDGQVLSYAIVSNNNPGLVNAAIIDSLQGPGKALSLVFASQMNGVVMIVVQASNPDGDSVSDTLSLTVSSVNDIPEAFDDVMVLEEDGTATLDVLSNDTLGDPENSITAYGVTLMLDGISFPHSSESTPTSVLDDSGDLVTLPNGSLSISGSQITYTPKDNFAGADFFTYTLTDADGDFSTANVSVTVNAVNDAPVLVSNISYTIPQATFLDISALNGLLASAIDYDGDVVTVLALGSALSSTLVDADTGELLYPNTALVVQADGAFSYVPDVSFVGIDEFEIQFFDGAALSQTVVVSITVLAAAPPPAPAPPGEVQFIYDLADVPLEDAISADTNVLVVMDDSGSMDWDLMTNELSGQFFLRNANTKDPATPSTSTLYRYILDLPSNSFTGVTGRVLPIEDSLNADTDFAGNDYGVWRGRSPQYNTVYYNREVRYEPWIGLDSDGNDFSDVNPASAPLNAFDVIPQFFDLTATYTFTSQKVPTTSNVLDGKKDIQNRDVYLAMYNWTDAVGLPSWNDTYVKVEITSANAPFSGGPDRLDCAIPLSCTYAEEIQNFANWFTYYRSREYTVKAALGRTVAEVSRLRLGYAALNEATEALPVNLMNASMRSGNKKDMMDQVYKIDSNGNTPLRQALDKAGRYFECKSGDSFGSTSDSNPGDPECPVEAAPQGQCQANYVLLFSDGAWNGDDPSVPGNHDLDAVGDGSSTEFDEGVFGDSYTSTLADIAMYYYERDLHTGLSDGVPTTEFDTRAASSTAFGVDDQVMHQHMKTYTIGFGLEGSVDADSIPTDFTTPFAWPDPTASAATKIDDMLHAAVNGRGQYLEANDPVSLAQALQTAFNVFTDDSVSVSAVAFSTTSLRNGTVEYRGFFNPKFNTGDLMAFNVNAVSGVVDADNPIWRAAEEMDGGDHATRIIATYDRTVNSAIPFRFGSLSTDHLVNLSEAETNFVRGDRSNEQPLGVLRTRPERDGLIGDIVHSAPQYVQSSRASRRDQNPFPDSSGDLYSDFAASNQTRKPIVYVGANDGMLHAFDADNGREKFAYIPNKLVDSSQNFANQVVGLTSITYAHKFFVDATPTIEDVFMPRSKASATRTWNTVLVGGLGSGGKGYYALNISDPAGDYSSESAALDTVLWEFTDADDSYPLDSSGQPLGGGTWVDNFGLPVKDLGFTYSPAQLVMTNVVSGGDNIWAAIFGNGYNSTAGIAKLFMLNLDGGLDGTWSSSDFYKLDTGEGVRAVPDTLAGLPNGLGVPAIIDEDLNGTADLVYAGDLFGNLYRFDISDSDKSKWTTTKLFQATYTAGGVTNRQPITVQPYVRKHPTQEGFIVIFATGSFITDADAVSKDIQSVYGIWDRGAGELNPPTANSDSKSLRLVQQTISNVYDESVVPFNRLRRITNNAVEYQADDAAGNPGTYGWYFDFDVERPALTVQGNANPDTTGLAAPDAQYPGERAIRRIIPRGDEILITTIVPRDDNSCLLAPPGAIFPVNSLTGGNSEGPLFDFNNDGVIDDDDLVNGYSVGIVIDNDMLNGSLVDPSLLLGEGDTDFLFLSGGDEQVSLRVAQGGKSKTGRLSWRELDDAR